MFMFLGQTYEGLRYEEGNCGVSVMRSGWCFVLIRNIIH